MVPRTVPSAVIMGDYYNRKKAYETEGENTEGSRLQRGGHEGPRAGETLREASVPG